MAFPLPFTCQHEAYSSDVKDDHGNDVPEWADPVDAPCFWWSGASTEPLVAPTGSDQAAADLTLVVDAALTVDHRDVFTVSGRKFEVIGLPEDWDHGPFGYQPDRLVIELKWVG